MAFCSSFTRFHVTQPDGISDFWSYIDEKLREGAFKECASDQERSAGFTSFEDMFNMNFDSVHIGEYIVFNYRIDQRKVSKSVLKKFVREEIQKYRDNNGGKFPAKKERQEIKENVYFMLLSRAIPQPKAYQVIWNTKDEMLIFGATSNAIIESFLELFENVFKAYPKPIMNADWAKYLPDLDSVQKTTLDTLFHDKTDVSMGYEFLTWLMYSIYNGKNLKHNVMIGDKIALSLPANDKEKVVCNMDDTDELPETYTALMHGKMVESVQLLLNVDDRDYSVVLDNRLFSIKGLKTPKQQPKEEDTDTDGIFLEKMFFIEEALGILNGVFQTFCTQRASSSWSLEILPQVREWINGNN